MTAQEWLDGIDAERVQQAYEVLIVLALLTLAGWIIDYLRRKVR